MTATLSEILDAVGSLLTEDQKDQLAAQLIGSQLKLVQPGDLITAELFNSVLANIADLAIRVSALEGVSGGPYIDHIEPQGIAIPVNATMTIVGRGFRPGNSDNLVTIDNVTISAFSLASDDSHLVFTVPDSFAQLPRVAQVKVKVGDANSNTVSVGIAPEVVVQSGTVAIRSIGPALGMIKEGNTYTLIWQVLAATRLPATYTFKSVVSNVVGASAKDWTDNIQVGQPGPVQLDSGEAISVTMTLKVPTGATSANIALTASSDDKAITGTAAPIVFAVGKEGETSDPRAVIALTQQNPKFNGLPNPLVNATIDALPGVTMTANGTSQLYVQLNVLAGDPSAQGIYKYSAKVEGETSRWTLGTPVPASNTNVTSASSPKIFFPIQSSTGDTTTVSQITIYAKKYTNAADATPVFTSLVTVPIKGA